MQLTMKQQPKGRKTILSWLWEWNNCNNMELLKDTEQQLVCHVSLFAKYSLFSERCIGWVLENLSLKTSELKFSCWQFKTIINEAVDFPFLVHVLYVVFHLRTESVKLVRTLVAKLVDYLSGCMSMCSLKLVWQFCT